MPRGITVALANALEANIIRPVLLVELEFGLTFVRLSDQDRDLTWDSKTWLGNGLLRPPRGMNESSELKGTGAQIVLPGSSSELLELVLNESRHSSVVRVWFGALDSNFSIIADPYLTFEGYLDIPEIQDSGSASSIIINADSDYSILDQASDLRVTHETQQIFFPGDKGFEYVTQAAIGRPFWGKAEKPPKTTRRIAQNTSKKGGTK